MHRTVTLLLNPTGAIPAGPKRKSVQGVVSSNRALSAWRKFEHFNFPVHETDDHFFHLRVHFMKLKRAYVDSNYIHESSGEIDHASVFVDQNYDSLEKEDGR